MEKEKADHQFMEKEKVDHQLMGKEKAGLQLTEMVTVAHPHKEKGEVDLLLKEKDRAGHRLKDLQIMTEEQNHQDRLKNTTAMDSPNMEQGRLLILVLFLFM